MRCAILAFVAGAALLQMQPALPSAATMLACAGAALAVLLFARGAARAVACGALFGFCWAALLAHAALAPRLDPADEGRDIHVTGTIDSLPNRFEQGVRFNLAVESASAKLPPRIALAWYTGYRDTVQPVADVQPGERWDLTVRLQRPHGNANPYGFDYEVWLLEQGLRATGYVRSEGARNRRLDGFVFSARNVVERSRAALRSRILRALPEHEYAGVIVALVVGDQRAIGQSDWTVFNRTGISHLISISGLHITMVAGMFSLAASALWRRSFHTRLQLPLLLPAQKVAALTGATVALLYVLLAGFGVPAQRTLYMLTVVAAALWFGRITNVSHVLCAALGMVVLLDPWAVLGPGFWLSFGAVAVILYATVGRAGMRADGWQDALRLGAHTQYAVTIGLVPLTLLLFAQVSIVSPLANALAIPLVSFIVTPLALAGSLAPEPLADLLLGAAHLGVELLAGFLKWLGAQRFAVWSAPAPHWLVFGWAVFGTLWMLAPRGWPQRWLGLSAWIPLLAGQPTSPEPGRIDVTAFDVGQGSALLVETSGHRLLVDTGPTYSPQANGANRIVAPYLKGRGIDMLDGLIVTHSDADHSGGALSLLDSVRVGWVASSLWPDHPIVLAAPNHRRCVAGQRWTWDGVQFEMLHPTAASYADASLKPNARGCTLRITAGNTSILLAADIEAAQEAELVQRAAGQLRADVLLVPHHGSGTSSTAPFLQAVKPRIALFQVGHRNRYRHPKEAVVERYRQMGVAQLRTDVAGAVTLKLGERVEVSTYRSEHQRYWYGR